MFGVSAYLFMTRYFTVSCRQQSSPIKPPYRSQIQAWSDLVNDRWLEKYDVPARLPFPVN